jgi:hypothetical protein
LRKNRFALALVLCVALVGCAKKTLNPVHQAMLGHWKEVSTKATASDPNYKANVLSAKTTELYISATSAWVIGPGDAPRQLSYSVSDVDEAAFTLTQHVSPPKGETISSRVTFSADRSEMTNTLVSKNPIGSTTLTFVYLRIDDTTAPP